MVNFCHRISKVFSFLPFAALDKYEVVAQPEGESEGFWAGGCSALKDKRRKIWLIYRLRNPKRRGHTLCILSSEDGVNFQNVTCFRKEDIINASSLERACLVQDPSTAKYKLYVSVEKEGKWYIYKLKDAISPKEFSPSTAYPVFSPSSEGEDTRKVKDPYIVNFFNTWYMFYSGSGKEPQEETFLAISQDGERWNRQGKILSRNFWHNYHTRMSCIIPVEKRFFFLYEGSSFSWYKPHFNLNIGLGYTVDMRNFFDITPQKPFLSSSTSGKFSTLRYIDCVFLDNKVLFYYEAARKDGSFELRVTACEKNVTTNCLWR